jgi:hypothetical protein
MLGVDEESSSPVTGSGIVNLCRVDLSILKLIGCRRDVLALPHPGNNASGNTEANVLKTGG